MGTLQSDGNPVLKGSIGDGYDFGPAAISESAWRLNVEFNGCDQVA